jgi:hypothetical protein
VDKPPRYVVCNTELLSLEVERAVQGPKRENCAPWFILLRSDQEMQLFRCMGHRCGFLRGGRRIGQLGVSLPSPVSHRSGDPTEPGLKGVVNRRDRWCAKKLLFGYTVSTLRLEDQLLGGSPPQVASWEADSSASAALGGMTAKGGNGRNFRLSRCRINRQPEYYGISPVR